LNATKDQASGELNAQVSADVAQFSVVYTTDVNGPPLQLEGNKYDRVIMYPIQLGVLVPATKITGSIRTDGKKVTGNAKFN
jgi:hypothetical protein